LDTGSITDGIIEEFQIYKLANAPSRAQRIINDNDIVYSVVRPIQRHYGLLNDLKPNTVASTGFCVLTATEVSPHFIYLLLTSDESVEYFDVIAEASTSTYPSLKPSDIANFEFRMPPLEKLDSFSKYATNAWNKIKSNKNQIRTLTQLRDTLLPKLMSGEVRVSEL
jgi:type I restriction enzyme S subunit